MRVLLIVLLLASPLSADVVHLTSGKRLEGRVLRETADEVLVRVSRRNRTYPREEVAEVHSVERSLKAFIERYDQIDLTSPYAVAQLAAFCEDTGLEDEAQNLWLRLLTLDPESAEAYEGLGERESSAKGWQLKVDRKWLTWGQLLQRKSEWRSAWEVEAAHFVVKTDIEIARVLDVLVRMERAYLAFYDQIGVELGLYVFDEKPEVFIYEDPDRYPVPRTPGDSWFELVPNRLHVLF